MGFYPYGNDGKVKNGQAIDRALAGFYSECIRKDAVVVAHAGPSYCATPGNCEYPGPDGWRCALKFVLDNENKPLRAALAHFGGQFDDKPEASIWPEAFLDLMKEGYGQKLYADLSYANEVLDPLKQTHVVNRLIDLGKHSPLLYERLTYGSDWLLLGLEMQWRSYAKRMEVVIDKTEKRSGATGFKARFFGGNAHDWLGLNEPISLGSKNTDGL
jgi:hypothetical protein